jgi:RNA polymerase sigma-70 factor (ECF subfamily)
MLTESDDNLVLRAQRGDRAAFEALVHRTARLVYARLYLETGDVQQAEDLAQEVFLAAWRGIGRVVRPEGFRAWLLAIAQNQAIDAARRAGRLKRPRLAGDADVLLRLPSAQPGPVQRLEDQERREQVLALLRSLPEEYRLALTLRYIGGLDHPSIAGQMGISDGALRGLLARGLTQLRESWSQQQARAG